MRNAGTELRGTNMGPDQYSNGGAEESTASDGAQHFNI